MTALALRGYSLGRNFLEGIFGIFGRFAKAVEVSRQLETNRRIGYMLRHEYPGLTDEQIISELNAKTLKAWRNAQ